MNYIFSILNITTKELHFYSCMDSRLLRLEKTSPGLDSALYHEVLKGVSDRINSDQTIREKIHFLVGFGAEQCMQLSKGNKRVNFTFNMEAVNTDCFEPFKERLFKLHGPVQFVSLELKTREAAWTQFLLKPFLLNFQLSQDLGKEVNSVIEEFKASFLKGVDHIIYINTKEAQIIFELPENTVQTLLTKAPKYPTQNGIISIDLGNGVESDFIYSLTKRQTGSSLCCFRYQGDKIGVSVSRIDEKGRITLLSPSGINDASNTLRLIGLINPIESEVNLFKKNISVSLPLGKNISKSLDAKDIIPIRSYQVLVLNT